MKNRMLALLLTLLMVLGVAASSLAAEQYVVSVTLGSELSQVEGLDSLLNAFAVRVEKGNGVAHVTLTLSDKDIVDFSVKADQDALCVTSGMLNNKAYYVSWDEALQLGRSLASSMDDDTAPAMNSFLDSCESMLAAWRSGQTLQQNTSAEMMLPEETVEMLNEMEAGLGDAIKPMLDKMIVEEGSFEAEGRDPADIKITAVFTQDDYLLLLDSEWVLNTIREALSQQEPDLTGDELEKELAENVQEAKDAFAKMDMTINTVAFYAEGELVGEESSVNADLTAIFEEVKKEDQETELPDPKMNLQLTMNRLTGADGADYTLFADGAAFGMPLQMQVNALKQGEKLVDCTCALLLSGVELTAAYQSQATEAGSESTLALYVRENAVAIIEPAASDIPVVVIKVAASEVDDSVLPTLDAGSAVNLLAMSDDDVENLSGAVQGNLTQLIFTLISAVPSDALPLVTGLLGF